MNLKWLYYCFFIFLAVLSCSDTSQNAELIPGKWKLCRVSPAVLWQKKICFKLGINFCWDKIWVCSGDCLHSTLSATSCWDYGCVSPQLASPKWSKCKGCLSGLLVALASKPKALRCMLPLNLTPESFWCFDNLMCKPFFLSLLPLGCNFFFWK